MQQSSYDEKTLAAFINNDIGSLDNIISRSLNLNRIITILSNNLDRIPKTNDIIELILSARYLGLMSIYKLVIKQQNTNLFTLFVKASKDDERINGLVQSLVHIYSSSFKPFSKYYTTKMQSHIKTCLFIALEELSDLINIKMIMYLYYNMKSQNYPQVDCICYILFRCISEEKLNALDYYIIAEISLLVTSIATPKVLVDMIVSRLREDGAQWLLSNVELQEPPEGYVSLFSEDV